MVDAEIFVWEIKNIFLGIRELNAIFRCLVEGNKNNIPRNKLFPGTLLTRCLSIFIPGGGGLESSIPGNEISTFMVKTHPYPYFTRASSLLIFPTRSPN